MALYGKERRVKTYAGLCVERRRGYALALTINYRQRCSQHLQCVRGKGGRQAFPRGLPIDLSLQLTPRRRLRRQYYAIDHKIAWARDFNRNQMFVFSPSTNCPLGKANSYG